MQFVLSAYTSVIIIFHHHTYFDTQIRLTVLSTQSTVKLLSPWRNCYLSIFFILSFFSKHTVLLFPQSPAFCKHWTAILTCNDTALLVVTGFSYAHLQWRYSHTFSAFDSSWIVTAKIIQKNNHNTLNTQDVMQLYPTVPLQAQNWITVMCSNDLVDKLLMSTYRTRPPVNTQWWR